MRWLVVGLLFGAALVSPFCPVAEADEELQPPSADSARSRRLSGWVMGDNGPVADSEIRLVSLVAFACPCGKDIGASSEFPPCDCAQAMAQWQQRLDHCRTTVLARTRSDRQGRFELPLVPTGNALEVESTQGLGWMPLPRASGDVTLEVGRKRRPSVRLVVPQGHASADVQAGLIFDDGHCVPLVQEGDGWLPAVSIPDEGDDEPVLLVRGRGMDSLAYRYIPGHPELGNIVLRTPISLAGNCADQDEAQGKMQMAGARVVWESVFERPRIVRADPKGGFSFPDVPDRQARITCTASNGKRSGWWYDPRWGLGGIPLEDDRQESRCGFGVVVVDGKGRPVHGAEVIQWDGSPEMGTGGRSWSTDRRGRVCEDDLQRGGYLQVSAPVSLGGWCTGQKHWLQRPLSAAHPMARVTLNIRAVPRSGWKGRVLSPEGAPVPGARVDVELLTMKDCQSAGSATTTAADGTFTLSKMPHGRGEVVVRHRFFSEQRFQVDLPGPPRDLVLDRGASWSGRVLAPDGSVLRAFRIWFKKAGQLAGRGGRFGEFEDSFSLKALPPGKAEIAVTVSDHPLWGRRHLTLPVDIAPNEHRRQDIHWPTGAIIAGQVVSDATGQPVPQVFVMALPKGARDPVSQDHPDSVHIRTDSEGRFTFRHLAPGAWTVRAIGGKSEEVKTGDMNVRLSMPKAQQ